ncbi:oxygen-dependent choline dehydrogenase-like [Mya arenaria]|uniref:oxygen-dependent choline dehydrogenase-like n=1 Tax=Mya arenaria TaxID=6604 RepID=UPI0022E1A775|nr:oxygen-dependent choline dehydrogenase-like [Mya arenaria]
MKEIIVSTGVVNTPQLLMLSGIGPSKDLQKLDIEVVQDLPFEYRSDAYWECYIRHISTTEYHPCCTAPMGPDNDNSAVLDLNLRVRDIQIPELHSSSYHRRGGPIAVTYSPPSGLTPLGLKAGSELGYNVTDYNGEIPEGFSVVQSTLRNGIRSSTTDEFIAKEKRQNLDIVTRSFVTKINIQDKKANGVFFIRNGRKQYVKARKEIIVSTGAVNTPQLLMLSGIGPSKDLQKLDIEVVQDLPRLNKTEVSGQDPYDHPSIHANYYSNCEDINAVLGGIRIWEQLMETDTFREVGVDTSKTKFEYRLDAYWECYIRHISTTQYHPCCTAPMGLASDNSAVLDLNLRVRGIANLQVIDSSVFPNITSGNLNAPTVTVADKASNMIRGIGTVEEFKNRV